MHHLTFKYWYLALEIDFHVAQRRTLIYNNIPTENIDFVYRFLFLDLQNSRKPNPDKRTVIQFLSPRHLESENSWLEQWILFRSYMSEEIN